MDANAFLAPCPHVGSNEVELPKYRDPGEPEKYRLSAARLCAVKHEPPATPAFKTRYISALSSELAFECPHILLFDVQSSALAWLTARCVRFLPNFAQAWMRTAFVEWLLPNHAVLKMRKQGGEGAIVTELFETEAKVYDQLKPLQGVVVPRCYGQLRYNGSGALMLEHLGGISLLGNFQLLDRRVLVLNFERATLGLSGDERGFFMKTDIWDLADRYRDAQVYYRCKGLP
ncbi:hypothetical protein B0T14DRAFT_533966 [Immersiella caudata]|uniref:Uncharacterized protein n=1 Tax=Immersiella caudata TaxID=314043 RepID=A0AA39XH21_9PEZI|nr:hypothetical protein B0T14DRAFT_533966 [Immersiella caudata]